MRELTDEEKNTTAGARAFDVVTLQGWSRSNFQITTREVGEAIVKIVKQRSGNPDDAGCDWTTDDYGNTCIAGNLEWIVSCDPNIATLVDAANILMTGEPLKATEG